MERLGGEILDALEVAVIGKRPELELVLCALLADGLVLIEDLPGVGKTLIARSVAEVCSMSFSRIQFTPDLMPSDVTGASIWNQRPIGACVVERYSFCEIMLFSYGPPMPSVLLTSPPFQLSATVSGDWVASIDQNGCPLGYVVPCDLNWKTLYCSLTGKKTAGM